MKGTEVVYIVRAGTSYDPYSDTYEEDWTSPTETAVRTIAPLEPRPDGEPLERGRNRYTKGWTVYLPAGTDVTALDRIKVRGTVFQVDGDPAAWPTGTIVQAVTVAG